ncbi:MAG TPA: hypothetical protein VN611_00335 [Patescibacteria group bacterium]|nr:hypothetical protein [Patescibacteria group bacterium]
MAKDYLFRCGDCGLMWQPEDKDPNDKKCDRCGSENRTQVAQQEGRFGCTSHMNTHVENVNFKQ